MDLSPQRIQSIWNEYERLLEAVRMVGGISEQAVAEGAVVPRGWVPHPMLQYYVPADFITSTTVQ